MKTYLNIEKYQGRILSVLLYDNKSAVDLKESVMLHTNDAENYDHALTDLLIDGMICAIQSNPYTVYRRMA